MTHTPMSETQRFAAPGAVGAFNVIQLEHAEAIVTGAEAAKRPVVLQVSENTVRYHGSLGPLGTACVRIAEDSRVPVTVHLDHATSPQLIEEAMDLDIWSVMFDASALPHDDNVAATCEIADNLHRNEAWIEAELGEVGGKDGLHAPGVRTDPAQAAAYVAATGVDALAVAVGSSHAMVTRDAELDDDLIARIAAAVDVPLVLHGSSGVPDEGLASAVRHGMRKINIATQLNKEMTGAVRGALADERMVDPRKYLGPGRDAVAAEVERLLRLLA